MRKIHVIDIHAHILPGVDDGAVDWEETRAMLQMAYENGIQKIAATPHTCRQGSRSLRKLVRQLQEYAWEIDPDYTIVLGQELFYREGLVERLERGEALTLNGTQYVLVEFQPDVSFSYLYQSIRTLRCHGYLPVLAHAERYECLMKEEKLIPIRQIGCLIQMNYQSIGGRCWNKKTRWCRTQIRNDRVDLLATDMHHASYRTPDISKSMTWIKKHCTRTQIRRMTLENPEKVLRGEGAL